MVVQRGMFDAAAEEAEVAGVMAHELSRVLLRHGTANASNVAGEFSELMPRMVIVGEAVAQVEHRAIGLLAGTDNFSSTPLATRILSAHRVHR